MFDPEKVERFDVFVREGVMGDELESAVLSSDYDRLLEIHLRHVAMIANLFERCKEPLSEEKIASLKNGTWV